MALAVAVILWFFAGLVGVVLVVVFVPIHLGVTARSGSSPVLRLRVRLFSAGLPPVFTLAPGGRPSRKKPVAKPAKARRKRDKGPGGWVSARLRRGIPHLLTGLPELVSDTLAAIRLDFLRAGFRFGFSDPAETGRVYGQLCPVIYALPTDRVDLICTPDFDRRCLEGEIEMALHFQIIRLMAPAVGLFWRAVLWPR